MFSYNKDSESAAAILDKFDLSMILRECKATDLYDVIGKIEELKNPLLDEAVDALTTDELLNYITQRYKMNYQEVSHYELWWNVNSGRQVSEE